MTTTRRIPKSELESYFDAFSKHYLRDESTNTVTVEVLMPELGDQFEAEGSHLVGITYDPRTNAFELMLESGDHRIYEPSEVWVVEDTNGFVSTIEVVHSGGTKEVIRLNRLAVRRRD
jgi:hypothetical protein